MLTTLAQVKARLGGTSDSQDDLLLSLIGVASGMAEEMAGLEIGALRRVTDIVEYPQDAAGSAVSVRLRCRPVERVSDVRQLYRPGSPTDFSEASPLTPWSDYVVDDEGRFGRLTRVDARWLLRPRCLRVVYTAGMLDPGTTVANWATATVYAKGALVRAGADVYCAVAGHTSDAENHPHAIDGEDHWARVHQVPPLIQHAVAQQAMALFQSRDSAGFSEITLANGITTRVKDKPVPLLVETMQSWRAPL